MQSKPPTSPAKPRKTGRPTKERVDQETASKLLSLMALGMSKHAAAKALHVGFDTPQKVLTRNPEAFLEAQKSFARLAAGLGSQCWTTVDPSQMSDYQRLVGGAIMADKFLALTATPQQAGAVNVAIFESIRDQVAPRTLLPVDNRAIPVDTTSRQIKDNRPVGPIFEIVPKVANSPGEVRPDLGELGREA